MNCKQTSLSVTKKKYLLYYKFDLYSNYLYFNDFNLISVFRFVHLTVAVILVSLQLYGRKYLLFETAKNVFSQPLSANKNSYQPLAAVQNFYSTANRKPFTLSP